MGVHAVDALIAGETGKMVGIVNQEMVLCPLSDAWKKKSAFEPNLLKISRVLAT
jgi:6-phosphofructokinase 1